MGTVFLIVLYVGAFLIWPCIYSLIKKATKESEREPIAEIVILTVITFAFVFVFTQYK